MPDTGRKGAWGARSRFCSQVAPGCRSNHVLPRHATFQCVLRLSGQSRAPLASRLPTRLQPRDPQPLVRAAMALALPAHAAPSLPLDSPVLLGTFSSLKPQTRCPPWPEPGLDSLALGPVLCREKLDVVQAKQRTSQHGNFRTADISLRNEMTGLPAAPDRPRLFLRHCLIGTSQSSDPRSR